MNPPLAFRTAGVSFVVLCALTVNATASFVVGNLDRLSGPPGSVITVTGSDFATGGSYTVAVGGVTGPVQSVTSTAITFAVPASAVSGDVEISDGTDSVKAPTPFEVTRILAGTFAPPPGISLTGWSVSSGETTGDVVGDGTFSVEVALDQPTMVWIFRNPDDPSFMTLALPADSSLNVNSTTTAASLLYLVPVVANVSPAQAPTAWANLLSLSDLPALTALINQAAAGGYDYLDDARIEDKQASLILDYFLGISPPITTQGFKPTTVSDAKLLDLFPPPNPHPSFAYDPVLESRLDFNSDNRRQFLFSFNNLRDPSLDYVIDLYELEPSQFTNGFNSVAALQGQDSYIFANDVPWATGFVRAKLAGGKLDWFGAAYDALLNAVTSPIESQIGVTPNVFEIPRNQDAVFAAHAYSGNLWYGLDYTAYGQADLLNKVDPNGEWTRTLSANVVIAAVDLSSIVIDVKKLTGSDDAAKIHSLITSVYKSAVVYRSDAGISADQVYDLIKTIASSIVKTYVTEKAQNETLLAAAKRLGDRIAGTIANSLNVLKKVGAGLNAAERTFNLVSPKNLALERSVFVIGDPFQPRILRIEPRSGRAGDEVVIYGNNLFRIPDPGDDPVIPTVDFCTFQASSTDPDNAPIDAHLTANLLEARPNRLRVTVPAGWDGTFNTNGAFICVTRNDSGNKGDSRSLDEEGQFHHLPPPQVLSVEPKPIVTHSHFAINGANFTEGCKVYLDTYSELPVLQTQSNRMEVTSSFYTGTGEHSLTVVCGSVTNALPLVVDLGAPTRTPTSANTGGVVVRITQPDMSNTPDGKISVKEAMLIANGGLGRPIEQHDPCEFYSASDPGYCGPVQERETDHVDGDLGDGSGGGANANDIVIVDNSLIGAVANVNEALPKIASNDEFRFQDLVLDGSSAPSGAVCLSFDGTLDSYVHNLVISNWQGDAVQVVNDSAGNRLAYVTIANATGDGVLIGNASTNNACSDMAVDYVGGTGIHLEGDGSANTFSHIAVNFPGQHGVHLETRCLLNEFADVTIQGSGGDGVRVEGESDNNGFSTLGVATATQAGLRINGSKFNRMYLPSTGLTDSDAIYHPQSTIINCTNWGIVLENGAANNVLSAKVVGQNHAGGILITDAGTKENLFGRPYLRDPAYEEPIFTMISDNFGPGVCITNGATHNTITCVNIAGNKGDGMQIRGEDTDANLIKTVLTGFRYFITNSAPQPAPNEGNSITIGEGADLNIVTRAVDTRNGVNTADDHFRNTLLLDTGNGIEISGAADSNQVDSTTIGSTFNVSSFFTNGIPMYPVGHNGIVLTNGANHNLIGNVSLKRDIHIDATPGAGILLEGDGTDFNTILGVFIGDTDIYYDYSSDPASHCQYGIYLKDGPKGNQIGEPGPMDGTMQFGLGSGLVNALNQIDNVSIAGIVLDNCGGLVNTNDDRVDPNVLQNNALSRNEVGLLIQNNAQVNDIGGPMAFHSTGFVLFDNVYTIDENSIYGSRTAGIQIHDNFIPDEVHRNRFMNNTISSGQANAFPNGPVDPAVGPPSGTGILVDGTSAGNFIGESFGTLGNTVNQSPVGAYLDGVTGVTVRGIYFDGSNYNSPSRSVAGVIIHDGSANQIGGGTWGARNEMSRWDYYVDHLGSGIILTGTSDNWVYNNDIKLNAESGIAVMDSPGNWIGDGPGRPNRITQNNGNGVLIAGSASKFNRLRGNEIGTDVASTDLGNALSGIRIENGAANNLIGNSRSMILNGRSALVPGPNIIGYNGDHGVAVSGAASLGNSISNNSIFNNGQDGIHNELGGNHELAPPTNVTFGVSAVTGDAADLSATPPGSIVQVFSDTADQGQVFLGETTVRAGGGWSLAALPPMPYSHLNVNITSSTDGSSSEFTSVSWIRAFALARSDGQAPSPRAISFGAAPQSVMSIRATAAGGPVLVKSITFKASGTLADQTAWSDVTLYRDVEGDGMLSSADPEIGTGTIFDADDGTATINLTAGIVPEDQSQDWLLVFAPAGTLTEGDTFNVQIENATAVASEFQFPIGLAVAPTGSFPIRSDDFTLGASTANPVDAWRAANFPGQLDNPSVSGYDANPDGDNLPNLFEYLLGDDPNAYDANDGISYRMDAGHFVVDINTRSDAAGVKLSAESTEDLKTWLEGMPWLEASPIVTDLGGGRQQVSFRTANNIDSIDTLMVRLKLDLVAQ